MSFDSSFDPSFDSDVVPAPGPVFGTCTAALAVQVVSPLVFNSAAGYVKWSVAITIAGVVQTQLTGEVKISGGEDAARVASFSVIPASVPELLGFESSPVSIDVTLFRPGVSSTMRRFTGRVETVEFDPTTRVATLQCRDGYQERPKNCTSAADVEALFGGLASPMSKIVTWSDDQPDPLDYFRRLQDTMVGACAIDSSGSWRAIPWHIGAPAATFDAGDVFSESVKASWSNRRDLPSAIRAKLNFRFSRLHCVEIPITWDDPGYSDHLVYLLPVLAKTTIQQALESLGSWMIKGSPVMIGPVAGDHPVIVGGQTQHYVVPYETSISACSSLTATLYRRWYQQVQTSYVVDIPMGGSSEREDSTSATLTSSFDASQWETAPNTESSLGLYFLNPPVNPMPPTGYEGLPAPFPPANSALDYYPDLTLADVQAASRHAVSLALRRAAAGKRKQTVRFSRPIDPRWEIGAVLAISAYGVSATGQLVDFEDVLDMDSGDATSTLTLACPDGSGTVTSFTSTLAAPPMEVAHALLMPALGTHMGNWTSTPAVPVEDSLVGFLCNVYPTAPAADNAKPNYIPQFRLIMPEIPADVRDPLMIEAPISASVSIAGSGISVVF